MQTRLERKFDKNSKHAIALFLVGSVVLMGVFLYFGVPALFKLAGAISGANRQAEEVVEDRVVLNSPSLTVDYEATKSSEINVRGSADPDTRVELARNTISLGLETADKAGKFVFEDVTLEKGKNEFVARVVAKNGKKSEPSEIYVVYLSTIGPKLETSNKDGDTVHDNPYSFTGKVDPITANVTVNGNLAIVDSVGNFSYYMNLNEGDNKLTILATDQAGNETKQEMNLKYER